MRIAFVLLLGTAQVSEIGPGPSAGAFPVSDAESFGHQSLCLVLTPAPCARERASCGAVSHAPGTVGPFGQHGSADAATAHLDPKNGAFRGLGCRWHPIELVDLVHECFLPLVR